MPRARPSGTTAGPAGCSRRSWPTTSSSSTTTRTSEAPGHRLRMSELAGRTLSSKSRLSHQVSRMEEQGLVQREECLEDRRGAWAVLTEAGWQRLVAAAPSHVTSVRHWLVEALSPE